MSTTPSLGLTQLDAGLKQPEIVINANNLILDTAIGDAWTNWTPTWTNLSVGNGTIIAKFHQIGKLVLCRLSLVLGSSSSVSGDIQTSLPVNRATYGGTDGLTPLGTAAMFDVSASTVFYGSVINLSASVVAYRVHDAASTYIRAAGLSSTVPFTWTTSDQFAAQFIYEAA